MTDFVKCTAKKGGYAESRCEALCSVTEQYGKHAKRSKGLFHYAVVNIWTRENLGTRIILKQGPYMEKGIVLNVCPFCGGPLVDQENNARG